MSTRKRKALTLEERVNVVKRSKAGETAKCIAETLGVGKTQVQTIIKEQDDVIRRWEDGESGDRKSKQRKCPYSDLNQKVWDWFCEARGKNIPISGKLVQEQATLLAAEMGLDDFGASNGWLEKWQKRFSVNCALLCGESASVSQEVVEDWRKRLPSICEGYALADIFNADETGLFYRALPSRSLVAHGETSGVKENKNRVTALVAVSAAGEKLKPLIIGKSLKPRCFQSTDTRQLGIDYHAKKKAWMTGDILTQWAKQLNNKMRAQQRKILMFVDNCTAHPHLELSNVKFVMLPPNTTSRLQPCDAGIIQALKLNYRKRLLRHILYQMKVDKTATGPDLAGSTTILDAILWWKGACDQLQADTITKCFAKCGFSEDSSLPEDPTTEPETDRLTAEGVSQLLPEGMTLTDYASFDDGIQTRLLSVVDQNVETGDKEEEGEEDMKQPNTVIDHRTASHYVQELVKFGLANGLPEVAENLQTVQRSIEADLPS